MRKKPTTVIAVRAPDDVAEAIREEAARRNMTVNELLNLRLAAEFRRGSRVIKSDHEDMTADGEHEAIADLIQDETE